MSGEVQVHWGMVLPRIPYVTNPMVLTRDFVTNRWGAKLPEGCPKKVLEVLFRIVLVIPYVFASLGLLILALGNCCRRPAPIPKHVAATAAEIERLVDKVLEHCGNETQNYSALAILQFGEDSSEAEGKEASAKSPHVALKITRKPSTPVLVSTFDARSNTPVESDPKDASTEKAGILEIILLLMNDNNQVTANHKMVKVSILKRMVHPTSTHPCEILSFSGERDTKPQDYLSTVAIVPITTLDSPRLKHFTKYLSFI